MKLFLFQDKKSDVTAELVDFNFLYMCEIPMREAIYYVFFRHFKLGCFVLGAANISSRFEVDTTLR